jgi:hypothetical protein
MGKICPVVEATNFWSSVSGSGGSVASNAWLVLKPCWESCCSAELVSLEFSD